MTIEKPITRLELMTAGAYIQNMGYPAQYIKYIQSVEIDHPTDTDVNFQNALVDHGVLKEDAAMIAVIIESYLSKSFFVPPYFELISERNEFQKNLPEDILKVINFSNTRKTNQEHMISMVDIVIEQTESCKQLITEIKKCFSNFNWKEHTRDCKALVAHTELFREKLLQLRLMFTTHTSREV